MAVLVLKKPKILTFGAYGVFVRWYPTHKMDLIKPTSGDVDDCFLGHLFHPITGGNSHAGCRSTDSG